MYMASYGAKDSAQANLQSQIDRLQQELAVSTYSTYNPLASSDPVNGNLTYASSACGYSFQYPSEKTLLAVDSINAAKADGEVQGVYVAIPENGSCDLTVRFIGFD